MNRDSETRAIRGLAWAVMAMAPVCLAIDPLVPGPDWYTAAVVVPVLMVVAGFVLRRVPRAHGSLPAVDLAVVMLAGRKPRERLREIRAAQRSAGGDR